MRARGSICRLVALAAVLAAGVAAAGAEARTVHTSPHLWATVNICDTERHPDTVGVRASMPGSGRRGERMYVRLRLQYQDGAGRWREFANPQGTSTRWLSLGSARYRFRQTGWSFRFRLRPGERHRLRGVASFQWRRGGTVVRRAARVTRRGHPAPQADPKGYSASVCVLEGEAPDGAAEGSEDGSTVAPGGGSSPSEAGGAGAAPTTPDGRDR
jgi:hypothetical protein